MMSYEGRQTPTDDQELLRRAQASPAGFGELFDAYYERIYAYAYRRVGIRVAAEDIAACTFEDAFRGIHKVKWQGKPVLAWLYRIAARRVADHFRKARESGMELERYDGVESTMESRVEQAERHELVRAALSTLDFKDREIIRLTYFEECDAHQVATIFNCTPNSVYVRLHRALKRLQAVLRERQGQHGMD